MVRLRWTGKAISDLVRIHDFLAAVNPGAAARAVQMLTAAPDRLLEHPRLGPRVEDLGTREVRRLIVGPYEIRYEIEGSMIHIVRLWHGRQAR